MDLVSRNRPRLSVPGAGRTISAAVEERAAHVRRAVQYLLDGMQPGIDESFALVFGPRWNMIEAAAEPNTLRAAWALVNLIVLSRYEGLPGDLESAEEWFIPKGFPRLSPLILKQARDKAEESLSVLQFDSDFADLFPYILEAHGPGSRISVMKDPSTSKARAKKREVGVFYTPADVADYITGVLSNSLASESRFLDPACGTGVFLLALLRHHRAELGFIAESLYGIDCSILSIESCAFALLHACKGSFDIPHWCAWHLIRSNLAAQNSLQLHLRSKGDKKPRLDLKRRLMQGEIVPEVSIRSTDSTRLWHEADSKSVWELFPEASGGFDSVVGNPPYASISELQCQHIQESFSARPSTSAVGNTYPLFVEMMWRFTKPKSGHSGLVVPLSIAYHRGKQFAACRRAMRNAGGKWECAFFDREPHALFGEDVKTRNTIIFHHRAANRSISVTPLLKWTSRTREKLFNNLPFTNLGDFDFKPGIPKLGGHDEAVAFVALDTRTQRFDQLCTRITSSTIDEASVLDGPPTVFVASTAYNFLNVFRPFSGATNSYPLSKNKVHRLEFASENDATLAFSILSSRLTYWLWHSISDGFHVNSNFLRRIPFNRESFDVAAQSSLESAGETLWTALQANRIVSLNRGRHTIAFRSLGCARERDRIDRLVVRSIGLPISFAETLRAFVQKTVVVDENDSRRSHLKGYFQPLEVTP